MVWLALGVLIWSALHLFPALAVPARARCIGTLGEGPYKGLFTLSLLLGIGLMVFGWRSAPPVPVYAPPAWGRLAANGLVIVALLLFAVSAIPSNLRRFIRHPQLTGVAVWGAGHLLANGDRRSLVLFTGFVLWALAEMMSLNRRDGAWEKPEPTSLVGEWKPVLAALVAYFALFYAHPYVFGVSVAP